MKKILTLIFVAGMFTFFACGPSAADKAKREQEIKDSIAAVAKADSIAKAEALKAERELFVLDSLRQDSIMKAEVSKKVKAATNQPGKSKEVMKMKQKIEQKQTRPGASKVK